MNNKIKELEILLMSKWLDDTTALINTIAISNAGDPAADAAISDLQARLTSDEADEADQKSAITVLVQKLAAAPAPTTGTTGTTQPSSDTVS